MNIPEIKDLLEENYLKYNRRNFIDNDPISIPHLFSKKEDIEISAFLTSIISWGQRKTIIKNAKDLMMMMDMKPYDFIRNHSEGEVKRLENFLHRTFNGNDCIFFVQALKHIYSSDYGLENAFSIEENCLEDEFTLKSRIMNFRKLFFETKHLNRSQKHISNPEKNSSAKRLCMFLRWMVRTDKRGVDFGIWKTISPSELCLPLDVHTGRVGRELGLLKRTQDDWKSVEEITSVLRGFDKKDPIKYDFALFGIGVNEKNIFSVNSNSGRKIFTTQNKIRW